MNQSIQNYNTIVFKSRIGVMIYSIINRDRNLWQYIYPWPTAGNSNLAIGVIHFYEPLWSVRPDLELLASW